MKKELYQIVYCFLFSIVLSLSAAAIVIYANSEASSTSHKWEWNGKGWNISNKSGLPDSVGNPYGFMLGEVARGRSFTMVIPRSHLGLTKEARIHWWND